MPLFPGLPESVTVTGSGGGSVTANQGTAGASAWPVKGAGSAGTADAGVITIQGILGGNSVTVSGNVTAAQGSANSVANAWPEKITDGTNVVGVFQFHNTDNQGLGSGFGLNTGGVAQMVNASGNLDRQRGTAGDVANGIGVATGTQQLAWPVTVGPVTSGAITGSGTAQTITVTNVSGTVNGVAWALVVGSTLVLETNTATQEAFTITAINVGAKTVTGVIKNNHSSSAAATAFFFDQARSAMIADGSTGQGIAAGGTYLFNSGLNSSNGGWEAERSAAGEKDGATGTGTNIAAEYEHNSGGPALASGLASGFQFDKGRNLQGKGSQTQSITSTGAGNTSVVFGSAAATNLVQPGGQLVLSGGAAQEVVYITTSFVPGSSATVPLQSPVVNASQTLARFDIFATQGPQLNGFTATGLGLEEDCVYAPSTGLYYVERAADADAMAAQNIVAEHTTLWNGATFDRWKSSATTGVALIAKGIVTPVLALNAVTSNQTSATIDLGSCYQHISLFSSSTGGPSAGTLTLLVSLDGVAYFTTTTTTTVTAGNANGFAVLANTAVRYVQVQLSGLSGGTSPTVTARVGAT